MRGVGGTMKKPRRFGRALRLIRLSRPIAGDRLPRRVTPWTRSRNVPLPPGEPFRDWWARTRRGGP